MPRHSQSTVNKVISLHSRGYIHHAEIAAKTGLTINQVRHILYHHTLQRRCHITAYFIRQAMDRGVTKHALTTALLRRIATDDLCQAILDD